jgi:purine-binding chemotaxis protein CheW
MLSPNDAEQRRILKERAKLLARQAEEESSSLDDDLYVVQFLAAGQNYAFDGQLVREVSLCKELTRIPCTPPVIAGVVNVRSEIIPVLDTRQLFQLSTGWPINRKLIVLQHEDVRLGVLADDVIGVTRLSLSRLKPPLSNMSHEQARHVRGLTEDAVIVVDALSLMNDPRIIVNETVD